jgi:hypothetical protein
MLVRTLARRALPRKTVPVGYGLLHCSRILRNGYTGFAEEPFDVQSLGCRIESHIVKAESPVSQESIASVLSACSKLEAIFKESSSPSSPLPETSVEEARQLLSTVLSSNNVALSVPVLKQYFTTAPFPSPAACVKVLQRYNKQPGAAYIPRNISIIPFRRAAYDADFENAFAIMDTAVGTSSLYHQYAQKLMKKYAFYWLAGTGTILTGLEVVLQSGLVGYWPSTTMVHMMVLTYLTSLSIYAFLSFAGRASGAGECLEWISGTVPTYRYKHAAEMKQASLLTLMNRELPENQGECSLHMLKELRVRSMQVMEAEKETMLKEYWARGGEGFEWVEPDQDPAEILWRHKMEIARAQRIGSPFTRKDTDTSQWAERVAENRFIPHASLIDTGDKSLPPASS